MYEKIGVHIAELLRRHDCVVVPTFGAFIAQYKPAELNIAEKRLLPPSKVLAFNPDLRHNDALLITALAKSENYSYDEAQAAIAEFVKSWQEDLGLQGIVSVHHVGRFVADVNGRLHFLPETHNYNNDVYGMPILAVVPIAKTDYNIEEEPVIQLEKDKEDLRPSAPTRPLPTWRRSFYKWREMAIAAAVLGVMIGLGWKLVASTNEETAKANAIINRANNKINTPKLVSQPVPQKTEEAAVFPLPATVKSSETPVEPVKASPKPVSDASSNINKPLSSNNKTQNNTQNAKIVKAANIRTKTPAENVIIAEKSKNSEPVEVFTIALGSFQSPVNVEMLTQKAKDRGEAVATKQGLKGLTTVSMTVQLRRSELNAKLQAVRNVYGANAVVIKNK